MRLATSIDQWAREPLVFRAGDRVCLGGIVHEVEWSSNGGFETYCCHVENYQPDWLLAHAENEEQRQRYYEMAEQMQVASDAPTTCIWCLGQRLILERAPAIAEYLDPW